MKSNQETKMPFYTKAWFWVSFTLFVFPPLGILLLFKSFPRLNKNLKISISVIASIFWITVAILGATSTSRTFEIDGIKVSIRCQEMCSYIDDYGDKDALKILATIGVKEISGMPTSRYNDTVKLTTIDTKTDGVTEIALNYNENILVSIVHASYPAIVYYSENQDKDTVEYPGASEIEKQKDIERKAKEKAEAEKQKQKEAEKKAEEERKAKEALYPSQADTRRLCETGLKQNYPYNGTKVHFFGEITNQEHKTNQRLYQATVTIANAFNATYNATMQCIVSKNGNRIQIESFSIH